MLEEIAQDNLSRATASNQPMFSVDQDYDGLLQKKAEILEKWKSLGKDGQKAYKGLNIFESENGLPDLKDPSLIPAKNSSLLLNEIKARVNREDPLSLLPID